MQVWKGTEPGGQIIQGGVVTIGNFDGLHRGHQTLLKRALAHTSPRIVLTFDPHPMQIVAPERSLRRLFPREDLEEQLPKYDVDVLRIIQFTREFSRLPAREFLEKHVFEPFHPKALVAGYDFAFGSDREGTLEVLEDWCAEKEIELDVVPPLSESGDTVSSSRLRGLLGEGDVAQVSRLLGRYFYLRGEVVHGDGRGAGIGFATLNMKVENETLPALGVYVTRTIHQGKRYRSVTNVGMNPTFMTGGEIVKVETHLLDENPDWYGQKIDVEFMGRLRGEKKFADVEDLKRQIAKDVRKAREVLDKADEKMDRN